jgi:hypothetical protein
MRSVISYSAARILVFVLTLGVLYLIGARGFLLLALAVLVSGVVSLVLLSRQRDAVSSVIADSVESGRRRFEAARSAEDFDPEDEPAAQAAASPAAESGPTTAVEQSAPVEADARVADAVPAEKTAPADGAAPSDDAAPAKQGEPSATTQRGR